MKNLLNLVGFVALAALSFSPNAQAQQRAQYEQLVATHAKANNVPEVLVHRVIVRESKYHPDLVGRGGAIGLMQIKLATARGLGYTGDAEGLRDPDTNLSYGVKYLAGAYRAANSDHARAMHYYASGYYQVAKQQRLERLKHPEPVVASAPPKEEVKPVEQAPAEAEQAAVAPAEADATPGETEKPAEVPAKPKAAVSKPKKPSKKLADAKLPVPRPPAAIPSGANAAKPR
jgi:hypothetical protein